MTNHVPITDAELAAMKEWMENGELRYAQQLRLAREVEELRKNLDVELDLNTHLVRRIDELRAVLCECADALDAYGMDTGIVAKARSRAGG